MDEADLDHELIKEQLKIIDEAKKQLLRNEGSASAPIDFSVLSRALNGLLEVYSRLDRRDQLAVRNLSVQILSKNCFESKDAKFDLRFFSQVQIQMWMYIFMKQAKIEKGQSTSGGFEEYNSILSVIVDFTEAFLHHLRYAASSSSTGQSLPALNFTGVFRAASPFNRISVFSWTLLQLL